MGIDQIDKALEIAAVIRASEAGFARDCRQGAAFGCDGDRIRLDAYSLGLLDALAQKLGRRNETFELLAYLLALLEHGPGARARESFRSLQLLKDDPALSRYVAGGRRRILRIASGNHAQVGHFADLLFDDAQGL